MGIPGSDWLEVPTIYVWPIFRAEFQEISPQNMGNNMVLTYLHVLDPEIPIDVSCYGRSSYGVWSSIPYWKSTHNVYICVYKALSHAYEHGSMTFLEIETMLWPWNMCEFSHPHNLVKCLGESLRTQAILDGQKSTSHEPLLSSASQETQDTNMRSDMTKYDKATKWSECHLLA